MDTSAALAAEARLESAVLLLDLDESEVAALHSVRQMDPATVSCVASIIEKASGTVENEVDALDWAAAVVHEEARWQWERDRRMGAAGAQLIAQRMGVVEAVIRARIDIIRGSAT